MEEILKRIRSLTALQLENPDEDTSTIFFHMMEEVGEFSTAVCIEEGSGREVFDKYDWLKLQEIVDQLPRNWETDRLRDKILDARIHQ